MNIMNTFYIYVDPSYSHQFHTLKLFFNCSKYAMSSLLIDGMNIWIASWKSVIATTTSSAIGSFDWSFAAMQKKINCNLKSKALQFVGITFLMLIDCSTNGR